MMANKLELVVAIPPGGKIARIELVSSMKDARTLLRWDASNSALSSIGINLEGSALTAEKSNSWEQPLPQLVRLTLPLDRAFLFGRSSCVIFVRDNNGGLLAEARFLD